MEPGTKHNPHMLETASWTMDRARTARPRRARAVRTLATTLAAAALLATVACGSREPPETEPSAPDTAARPAGTEVADPSSPRPSPNMYTVQPGDTLWSLARRFGVTVDDLVAANDLADPDQLSVGEQLIVPGATTVTANATADRSGGATRPAPAADGDSWAWPVSGGTVLSGFGARRGGSVHRGLDIDADPGQQVVAAWSGVVVFAGGGMRDYGNAVIIDHGRGLTSLYGHNSEILVRQGERVRRGQPIARAGETGNATTVHCHFEVRRYEQALDPMSFLSGTTR